MKKIIHKIAGLALGLSLAMGVGVALSSHRDAAAVKAETSTFSHNDLVGMATAATADTSGTYGGFTVTVSNGLNATESVRVYKGETITIASSVGNMTSVELTCTASGTAKYGPGCLTGTGWNAGTGTTGTWTGNADSFTLTASSNQARVVSFKITYSATSSPSISLNPTSIWLVNEGDAKNVSVSYNNFSSTPTISVQGTPSYVNCSVSGTTVSVSPKAVGSETITIKGTAGTQSATKTLDVVVYPKHGLVGDDPFSVAEAKAAIDAGAPVQSVYVTGIISQIDTPSQFSGQICYWISDDGTTSNQFEIYWGRGLNNQNFSSLNDIELGATVVNFGNIKKFNTTYEFDSGSYLYSYSAPAAELSSISLSGTYKTTFEQNEAFTSAGLVVTASYDTGSSKEVTPTSISSPDMTTIGQKTVTVTYTEGEITKTAEYTIQVNAVTTKYTVSFLPGEGSGEMASVQVSEGEDYTLPECTFTAPTGKVFDHWEFEGSEITEINDIDDDFEVVAIWKDGPAETTVSTTIEAYASANNWADATQYLTLSLDENVDVVAEGGGNTGKYYNNGKNWRLYQGENPSLTITAKNGLSLISITIEYSSNSGGILLKDDGSAYNSGDKLNLGNVSEYVFSVGNSGTATNGQARITSIEVVYGSSSTPPVEPTLTGISVSGAKTDFTVGDDFVTTGLVVTAHYQDADDRIITAGYTVDDSEVDKTQAGTYTVTVTYENSSDTYDVTYTAPTPVEVSTYKKVKTNLADFSGKYLIVCEEEGSLFAFDGSLATLDATSNTQTITISNETISLSSEYEFTIASKENGYSIKSSSNLYIGQTTDGNGLKSSATDDYTNSISFDGTSMDIVSSGAHMRYNATSGQDRFRYFKSSTYSSQKAIALYQKVDAADALALDLLNNTYGVCSQGYDNQKSDFEEIWSTLGIAFNALSPELKSKLAGVQADKDGVMIKESMARYDLLTGKYGLTNFITARTPTITSGSNVYLTETNTNAPTIIIVIVAITSITSIGVLLVIKKRRVHQ